MAYTAHITKARIPAHIIYVEAPARAYIKQGPIQISFPGGLTLEGEVRPWDGNPKMVIHCPALYGRNAKCADLPLQLHDYVDYEIRGGNLEIVAIRRTGGSPLVTPSPKHLAKLTAETTPSAPSSTLSASLKTTHGSGSVDAAALLCFDALPPLPDYLAQNQNTIRALADQALPAWGSEYDGVCSLVMARLRKQFPSKVISRTDLVELYTDWNDPALCLVATMVWGNIDVRKSGHLQDLLKVPQEDLKKSICSIRNRVRSGRVDEAFVQCGNGGTLKLPGVGVSFFTKLFFFVGQVPPVMQPAPLIFDKWTANALYALGNQVCPQIAWGDYFDTRPLRKGEPVVLKLSLKVQQECYRIYVAWMNHWAFALDVSAAKLEQFVFGHSRKTQIGKGPANPRNELLALAISP